MNTEILSLDLPQAPMQVHNPNFFSLSQLGGEYPSATWPSLPSLLRKANRRFLMDRIDTTTIPDFATLTDISYDHDLFTALGMISFDTIKKMKLGKPKDDDLYIRYLNDLDAVIDIPDLFRSVAYDELRYGNAVVINRKEEKTIVDCDIIHPGLIKSMKLGPDNKPMWWVFKKTTDEISFDNYDMNDVVYLNPKYESNFKADGLSGDIVGTPDQVVHFKGPALRYQTWGIGIAQIAKILIEAKIDMMVDFSKIIKMNASPKEYLYVNVAGLNDSAAQAKINATIESVSQQRMLSSIVVLAMDEGKAEIVGSEGKVLDNFTMHYRNDILMAIRMLTRIPPSFWLGESTNKATINSQLTVYNGFIESNRWFESRKFHREIFYPYLKGFDSTLKLDETPEIRFMGQAIEDPVDKVMIDDTLVRMGAKSRLQVSEEWDTRLPEADGEMPPSLGSGSKLMEVTKQGKVSKELNPDAL
jgi:hypothetical protein